MTIKKNNTEKKLVINKENNGLNHLFHKLSDHIDNTYRNAIVLIAQSYWLIGRDIVTEEQKGKTTVDYVSYIIKELSSRLNKQYGEGSFGVTKLRNARQYYLQIESKEYEGPPITAKQLFEVEDEDTYKFHLPTEEELEAELKKEIKNFKEDIEFNQDFESDQSYSDSSDVR